MKAFLFFAMSLAAFSASAFEVQSGPRAVPLLELYTSEGCSSCPPADRWLSELKSDPGLFARFVPVAFHVDYWDYIGWRDRFARSAYTERQRTLSGGGTMYTPEFFLDAHEWRIRSRTALSAGPEVGILHAKRVGDEFEISFAPSKPGAPLTFHVAKLGMGLTSPVRAGENRGETLHHDFVVVDHRALDAASVAVKTVHIKMDDHAAPDAKGTAYVFWVTERGSEIPIQAAGGFAKP